MCLLGFFETGSSYVAQAGFKLLILASQESLEFFPQKSYIHYILVGQSK
jgi:hypothetical protein